VIKNLSFVSRNKSSVFLLVFALIVGGVGAQAAGVLNTPSGGYLLCVNPKTAVTTFPAKTKCPSGYKKLILGAQGIQGITGEAGPSGVNGGGGPAGATGAAGSNANLTCAQGGLCVVGNTGPGGGIVFYVHDATATAPWRYLEAAPNTWSGGVEDPSAKWCSVVDNEAPLLSTGDTSAVHTLTTIGSGFSNTRMMIGSCSFGAANMAASYNGGGKSDWFLPSKAELNELYAQRVIVGGFIPDAPPTRSPYHSSSENNANADLVKEFATGFDGTGDKNANYYVRPVRAF